MEEDNRFSNVDSKKSALKWVMVENTNPQIFYDTLEMLHTKYKGTVRYICGQLERGGTTGKLHFQGYIQLLKKQRLSWLKKNISPTAYFAQQKASCNADARGYCMKEETKESEFIEFGVYTKGRGARTDLYKFMEDVKSGKNRKQLIEEHYKVFSNHRHFYGTLREIFEPDKMGKYKTISIYFGDPGTGKTFRAVSHDDIWKKPPGDFKWFSGYDMQKVAIFDDFAGKMSKVGFSYLNQLLDRYPTYQQNKGGHIWFHPDKIIITTNYHPRRWYDWSTREISYLALQRRITEVIVFTKEGQVERDPEMFFQDKTLWPGYEKPREQLEPPLWNQRSYDNYYPIVDRHMDGWG